MYGLIEIGMSSIDLYVYEADYDDIKLSYAKKNSKGIAEFINADSQLTDEGINEISQILSDYKDITDKLDVSQLSVISDTLTYGISNSAYALSKINQQSMLKCKISAE